jgi:hypothetical protein
MESLSGDTIFFIAKGYASPYKQSFNYDTAKEFNIGDQVIFIDGYKESNCSQDYLSWFVIFKDNSGQEFAMTQEYFVTEEGWGNLADYFSSH